MNTVTSAAMRCVFAGGVPPGPREVARLERIALLATFAFLVATMVVPDVAQAQQLDGVIQWVRTNIVKVAISAGIIFVALTLLALRFNYIFVCFVACGGLIAANYQQIAGLFPV